MAVLVELREVVKHATGTRNPTQSPGDIFTYVDVAAVDNVKKIIVGERSILGSEAPSRARKLILTGDTLVSTVRPNLNAVAMVPAALHGQVASTGFCVLRPTSKVLPEYLFYFACSRGFVDGLSSLVAGAMYPAVSDSQVLDQQLPLIPIDEQQCSVDLLSGAEGISRLRRDAGQKAAELVPAIFLDIFGDPGANSKGWPQRRLGDIADVVSGVTKGRRLNGRATTLVPYLRVANVQAGHLDLSELKEIEALPREVVDLALRTGDVVLTEGGDHDKLGRGAMWEYDVPNCIHQNHIFRVRLREHAVSPTFFVTYLQTDAARSYFLRSAKRTTNLASINMTQLRDLPVPVPPRALQETFEMHFRNVRSIETQQGAAAELANATFEALLARTFDDRQLQSSRVPSLVE